MLQLWKIKYIYLFRLHNNDFVNVISLLDNHAYKFLFYFSNLHIHLYTHTTGISILIIPLLFTYFTMFKPYYNYNLGLNMYNIQSRIEHV